jgi:hypothetical protein
MLRRFYIILKSVAWGEDWPNPLFPFIPKDRLFDYTNKFQYEIPIEYYLIN